MARRVIYAHKMSNRVNDKRPQDSCSVSAIGWVHLTMRILIALKVALPLIEAIVVKLIVAGDFRSCGSAAICGRIEGAPKDFVVLHADSAVGAAELARSGRWILARCWCVVVELNDAVWLIWEVVRRAVDEERFEDFLRDLLAAQCEALQLLQIECLHAVTELDDLTHRENVVVGKSECFDLC